MFILVTNCAQIALPESERNFVLRRTTGDPLLTASDIYPAAAFSYNRTDRLYCTSGPINFATTEDRETSSLFPGSKIVMCRDNKKWCKKRTGAWKRDGAACLVFP